MRKLAPEYGETYPGEKRKLSKLWNRIINTKDN